MRPLLLVAVLFVACGGGAARNPKCPATTPSSGSSCEPVVDCEYGGDALGRGTTVASCVSTMPSGPFSWTLKTNPVVPNPAACPSTFAAAMSGSCDADPNLVCEYDAGICGCVCSGQTLTWTCRARSDVQGGPPPCPTKRPLAGDACDASYAQQTCYYDKVCGAVHLSFGPALACRDGYWTITVDTSAACGQSSCPGWTP